MIFKSNYFRSSINFDLIIVGIISKQGTIAVDNPSETTTVRCIHNNALVGEFKYVTGNNL